MGILDELKQEAERVRHLQEEEERATAEIRGDRAGLRDRMVRIHHYLFELIEHLDVAGWQVAATYSLPGVGEVELIQGNYRIYIDNLQDPKKISLRFDCLASDTGHYSVTPKPIAEEFRKFLRSEQIAFAEWPIRDGAEIEGALFQCRLQVLVSLLFEARVEDSTVRVATHNFEALLDEKLKFHYQRIDDDWLDQVGHYVLRKDRRLSSLDISEDVRRQIRERLEADNRRRMRESGRGEMRGSEEKEGLFSRLGRLLRGSTRK